MKKIIQVNYIFWKEGPLLFDFARSRLPRLLTLNEKSTMEVEI